MLFRVEREDLFLPCPRRKQESEAFHWIRKESEFAKFVYGINFSYFDGFTVSIWIPIDWSDEQVMDIFCSVKADYNEKFMTSSEG